MRLISEPASEVLLIFEVYRRYITVSPTHVKRPKGSKCSAQIEKKKKIADSRLQLSLTDLTRPDDYVSGRFITYRYKLSPGTYLLVPNYMRNNQLVSDGRRFCIRVFSGTSLKCRSVALLLFRLSVFFLKYQLENHNLLMRVYCSRFREPN